MTSRIKQKFINALAFISIALLPMSAYAAPTDFKDLVNQFIGILSLAFPLIIGLIVVVLLWGLAKFVFSLGGADDTSDGKTIMFWGIAALFVAVSVWGFVRILTNTFL